MAEADKWRTLLNERQFSKKIRENNAKESIRKTRTESRGVIAANENDLFVWDNVSCHFQYYNLQNLNDQSPEKLNRSQVDNLTFCITLAKASPEDRKFLF